MHTVITVEQGMSLQFMFKAFHTMFSLDFKLCSWQGLRGLWSVCCVTGLDCGQQQGSELGLAWAQGSQCDRRMSKDPAPVGDVCFSSLKSVLCFPISLECWPSHSICS